MIPIFMMPLLPTFCKALCKGDALATYSVQPFSIKHLRRTSNTNAKDSSPDTTGHYFTSAQGFLVRQGYHPRLSLPLGYYHRFRIVDYLQDS